jgi:hypothetical protein
MPRVTYDFGRATSILTPYISMHDTVHAHSPLNESYTPSIDAAHRPSPALPLTLILKSKER